MFFKYPVTHLSNAQKFSLSLLNYAPLCSINYSTVNLQISFKTHMGSYSLIIVYTKQHYVVANLIVALIVGFLYF